MREGIAPDETMAFGDGFNDIGMLGYAGIGVAMGNAADAVKASARLCDGVCRGRRYRGSA